jgi:hypothetical protein
VFPTYKRLIIYSFAAFLALLGPAASAKEAISIAATAGFGGILKGQYWAPIAVELTNKTDRDIQGILTLEHVDFSVVRLSQCDAKVNLPSHSKKLYHIYSRFNEYEQSVRISLRITGGATIDRKIQLRRPCSAADTLVVCVRNREGGLSFLNGASVTASQPQPTPFTTRKSTIQVGSIKPWMLPNRPAAYFGADLVVLSDLDPGAIDPDTLKALAMWTASGGTLVIPAGINPQNLRHEFFSDLLPVEVEGIVDLPTLHCLSALGKLQFNLGPVSVVKAKLKPRVGTALAAESGIPIVAHRMYGAGRVIYIAFDPFAPPYRYWDGQTNFWKSIIELSRPESAIASPMQAPFSYFQGNNYQSKSWFAGSVFSLVVPRPAIQAPSSGFVGLFLLSYILLLSPASYLILRSLKRLELAWITTPATVLAFTIGAYALGHTMKGSALRLNQLTVIEGSDEARYARVVSTASVFSPARRSYEIGSSDPYALAESIVLSQREPALPGLVNGECIFPNVPMAMWSTKMFEFASGADLGGVVHSNLLLTPSRLKGTIENNTRHTLTNCLLFYGNQHKTLSNIAPGDRVTVDMPFVLNKSAPNFAGNPMPSLDTQLKTHLAYAAMSSGRPVLIAGLSGFRPLIYVKNAKPKTESAIRCLFYLGFQAESTFQLSPHQVRTTVEACYLANPERRGMGVGEINRPFGVSINPNGSCVVAFNLDLPTGTTLTSLTLVSKPEARGDKLAAKDIKLSVLNRQTGNWEALSPLGSTVVLDLKKYLSSNNKVWMKLENAGAFTHSVRLAVRAECK